MPQKIILIAAVTVDGYIARHSREIIKWSKDLHLFKKQTMGWSLVVGSNTYKTIKSELAGRQVFVVHRDNKPDETLSKINQNKCYIIGGGKTFSKYSPFITHLFITPHPYVFGSGVPLFSDKIKEMKLNFIKINIVDQDLGIYQYQYKVIK
tara:strand:- start:1367 stop:1819 length:453 start_codon:yes stop_codon:yes gene_type:complete